MYNKYKIDQLLKNLMVVYQNAMKPYYEESLYDNFIDNQTFERNKAKIGIIVHNRKKVQEFLKEQIEKK